MGRKPVWFGPKARPLLGWLHTPDESAARTGVVICPPLGVEHQEMYATLRVLAEDLAGLGFSVLRFDYDGTGNSAGSEGDTARVSAWLDSIKEALALLRGCGHTSVVLVGVRFGALLGSVVAQQDDDIQGLVLWDPPVSGRAYLLEQKLLGERSFHVPTSRVDGGMELPWLALDATAVADIGTLRLSLGDRGLARHVLVLHGEGGPSTQLVSCLSASHVEWAEAIGQQIVIEKGFNCGIVAHEINQTVIEWLARIAPGEDLEVTVLPGANEGIVGWTEDGKPIVERPMFLGGKGQFGILTETPGVNPKTTVVFLYGAGPGRLWVDCARRWAGAGLRCFRLDPSGLGDSPVRHDDQAAGVFRVPEHFDDVLEACSELSPEDPSNVVLIGHCAAGYQALDSAVAIRPRGVISLNPVIHFRFPEMQTGGRGDPRRTVGVPRNSVSYDDRLRAYYHYGGTDENTAHQTAFSTPFVKWHSKTASKPKTARQILGLVRRFRKHLALRLQMAAAPARRPSRWLTDLAGNGVDLLLVCGKAEVREVLFGMPGRVLDTLSGTGLFRLNYIPDLEHSSFTSDRRAMLEELFARHLMERILATPAAEHCLALVTLSDHS